jgi:hypothetical protein
MQPLRGFDNWLEKPYINQNKEEEKIENLYNKWFNNLSKDEQNLLEKLENHKIIDIYEAWLKAFYNAGHYDYD